LVTDEAIPIKDNKGNIIGSVVVFHNVSQVQADTELQQRNHELEEFQLTLISQLQEKNTQLQQAIACVQVLNQVIGQVRPSADENQILQITIHELGRALDADYCWVALHDDQHSIATIRSEYLNTDLLHRTSAIGTPISVQNYPQFYRQLFQHASWLYPHPTILPLPYRSLLFPGNQALICPIIVDQAPTTGTIDQMVIGEVGILMTGKPLWSQPQAKLISQIVSYAVTIVRQFHVCQVSTERIAKEQMFSFLKEDFISSISSQMRTPLTNMRMALEMFQRIIILLKNEQLEPMSDSKLLWQKMDQYLPILQEEWQREFNLVNDVLNFQSSVNSTASLTKSEIEFQQWIPEIINRFWTQVSRQKQILTYHVSPDLPIVFSHLSSLERIVTELLSNACRHTPPTQRITLSVEMIAAQLELKVTNTGSPIPPQELEEIFQPFYRVTKSNPCNYHGTGLGLTLVKKLVLNLGGSVYAESSKQVTTFTVTMPL
ncbi:MAG: HAMP domain-containing histidine kinase, partial [Nostocaceae cyanobacterium]|nr:HAMP domain-containing histidine kinase [Nostocaceae cyanobacterium]